MSGAAVLGMFAKYWQPGEVKTRLAAQIGARPAAEVYRAFVETLLARFARAADRRVLCCWPPERQAEFAALADGAWEVWPQPAGDLGQKMLGFFEEACGEGAARVVLIGSDSPDVPGEYVERAFALLAECDVVLGPAPDGGYYLVGASNRAPPIFAGIAWSTASVLGQTCARLAEVGLQYALLPEWDDVDERKDLERLGARLATAAPGAYDRLQAAVAESLGARGG